MSSSPTPVLDVASINALVPALRGCDVVVPERAKGRDKSDVERYSIVRLLGTLAWSPLDFPLRLHKSERPDFILDAGGRMTGIEHTETITENAAKEAFLRSRGHGPDAYFPRQMVLNEPRKSSREMIQEIRADRMGGASFGDSVERSWVEAMLHFIRDKIKDAQKPGFERFGRNWLIMYDNWSAHGLHREDAAMRLSKALEQDPPWETFDRIFILDERVLVDLEPTSVRLALKRDPRA